MMGGKECHPKTMEGTQVWGKLATISDTSHNAIAIAQCGCVAALRYSLGLLFH